MPLTFSTQDLAVGYNKRILIQDINIQLEPGTILTLIGPNGAGKSTVLKTITRQLQAISGTIFIGNLSSADFSNREFARKTSVLLTEHVDPERMTCEEVAAMGRYPYTNMFGTLSDHDKEVIRESLELVHASVLSDRDFSTLSDGQRQRIMLARAICQEPEILILDEPTAYLDIRFKIETLEILQKMSRDKGIIVIMSLHEIDLAMKVSDKLLCLDGEKVISYGSPEDIFSNHVIEDLYQFENGTYNNLFGSVEMPKITGEPLVFVIAGNGCGTPIFRALQRKAIPFAAGILFENDVDCQTAVSLSSHVVINKAFEKISEDKIRAAEQYIRNCKYVLDSGTVIGPLNEANKELISFARENGLPVFKRVEELSL